MEKNDFERLKLSSGKKRNDFVANPIQQHLDKGDNVSQDCEICDVYGEGVVLNSATRKWFACFGFGNFDAKHEVRSVRLITEKIEQDLLGSKKKKLVVWVPHELSVKNTMDRYIQTSLITHQKLRKLGWKMLMHPPYRVLY